MGVTWCRSRRWEREARTKGDAEDVGRVPIEQVEVVVVEQLRRVEDTLGRLRGGAGCPVAYGYVVTVGRGRRGARVGVRRWHDRGSIACALGAGRERARGGERGSTCAARLRDVPRVALRLEARVAVLGVEDAERVLVVLGGLGRLVLEGEDLVRLGIQRACQLLVVALVGWSQLVGVMKRSRKVRVR